MIEIDVADAVRLAHDLLAVALPRRLLHVSQVASEAERRGHRLPADERRLVICAGWLHDIGYAPAIAKTGFHPLDGARFLREEGWPAGICSLVAYHTGAIVEANHRGLAADLAGEFEDQPGIVRDVLWAADATTGPSGQGFTLAERIAEIGQRYGAEHLVSRCMGELQPQLQAAILRSADVAPLGRARTESKADSHQRVTFPVGRCIAR